MPATSTPSPALVQARRELAVVNAKLAKLQRALDVKKMAKAAQLARAEQAEQMTTLDRAIARAKTPEAREWQPEEPARLLIKKVHAAGGRRIARP